MQDSRLYTEIPHAVGKKKKKKLFLSPKEKPGFLDPSGIYMTFNR